MATLNTIKKQLAQLDIRTNAPALRELVSNVRDSSPGWTVNFDGKRVTGRAANQDASCAEVVIARSSYDSPSIKIAVRRAHSWQKLTIKQAHEDISEQLDDLLDEIEDQRSEDQASYTSGHGV